MIKKGDIGHVSKPTKSVTNKKGIADIDTVSVRPSSFDEIIGRIKEKKTLTMMIKSALGRKEPLDHILFYGPPGLGKTTFATAIANEMGSSLRITSGPAIDKQGDLATILTNLRTDDVLFIDEIHRLSRSVEEILYPAMEDGVLDIVVGKGPSAKNIRIKLKPFTLVGATTQIGKISSPLRDRFGLLMRLDYFGDEDLIEILKRAADIWNIQTSEDALSQIALRSRGTARIAIRLLRRVRDYTYASKGSDDTLSRQSVEETFSLLNIDEYGLEHIDRELLRVLYFNFGGGPVGISTLAAAISEDVATVTEVYEPFLMKLGLIKRTSRGRVLTQKGLKFVQNFDDK